METKNLQEQIIKKETELKVLKEKLNNLNIKDNLLFVKELNIEIEIDVTHKGESYNQIMSSEDIKEKLKNGWRLLSTCREKDFINEIVFLENNSKYSKTLKMDGSSTNDDFFIQQFFNLNKKNNFVAQFYSYSRGSSFSLGGDADVSRSGLGVRFVREKRRKDGKA